MMRFRFRFNEYNLMIEFQFINTAILGGIKQGHLVDGTQLEHCCGLWLE